jgi:iron-sulfur cluster insertion protein
MISMTDQAIIKIKEISEAEDIGHLSLRLKIIGGGCAGFSYDIFFDEGLLDMDEVQKINDISVLIDPISLQYLDGVEIDYVNTHMGAGFKFNNPNILGSCGCGSSFSI